MWPHGGQALPCLQASPAPSSPGDRQDGCVLWDTACPLSSSGSLWVPSCSQPVGLLCCGLPTTDPILYRAGGRIGGRYTSQTGSQGNSQQTQPLWAAHPESGFKCCVALSTLVGFFESHCSGCKMEPGWCQGCGCFLFVTEKVFLDQYRSMWPGGLSCVS